MTVQYNVYESEKIAFFKKHDMDYVQHTSELIDGGYHKEYVFEDGAVFYESMMRVEEVQILTAHGITTKVPVVYLRTEYWSSDKSGTNAVYENW